MALKVGVFLTSPVQVGGGFRMSLAASVLLGRASHIQHTFKFITTHKGNLPALKTHGLDSEYLPYGIAKRTIGEFARKSASFQRLLRVMQSQYGLRINPTIDGSLHRHSIDLVYFLEPTLIATHLTETNFIVTIFDLCHRDAVEFPEVRQPFLGRERIYRSCLPRAVAVITNCDVLADKIAVYYNVAKERIFVLPLLPQIAVQNHEHSTSEILKGFGVGEPYVFYPANFWAHKNHVYILEALRILRERAGILAHGVFCGVDRGNLDLVRRTAKELGLSGQVHFLGLVNDDEIVRLYKGALALVMPTYFGPTNMPPLEAALLGCPIIYSDLKPFREQFGDGALYCDLRAADSLADHLEKLIKQPQAAAELARTARAWLPSDVQGRYEETLSDIFDRYEYMSRRWK